MSKFVILMVILFFVQVGSAGEYSSKEIKTEDGINGSAIVRVDNYGTYSALFRKTEVSSKATLCETLKNGYWERNNGDIIFWSLGRAQLIPCHSKKTCLLFELGKNSPIFSNEVIELAEVPDGTLEQTPDSSICD